MKSMFIIVALMMMSAFSPNVNGQPGGGSPPCDCDCGQYTVYQEQFSYVDSQSGQTIYGWVCACFIPPNMYRLCDIILNPGSPMPTDWGELKSEAGLDIGLNWANDYCYDSGCQYSPPQNQVEIDEGGCWKWVTMTMHPWGIIRYYKRCNQATPSLCNRQILISCCPDVTYGCKAYPRVENIIANVLSCEDSTCQPSCRMEPRQFPPPPCPYKP